jgi:hypothetical protein
MAAKKNASKKVPKKSLLKDLRFLTRGLKQSKKQASQVKKTGKAISKGFGKLSKAVQKGKDQRELRQIERLLGEDFDTLAQARRALKKESKPVKANKQQKKGTGNTGRKPSTPKQKPPQASKKTSGKARSKTASKVPPKKTVPKSTGNVKSIFEFREIKGLRGKTPMEQLGYLQNHPEKLDNLLRPGDKLVARFYGDEAFETRATKNAHDMALKLQGSDSGIGGKELEEQKSILDNLQIVRFLGSPVEQERKIQTNREIGRERHRVAKKGARERVGGTTGTGKRKNVTDLLEASNAKIDELLKQLEEERKKNAKKSTSRKSTPKPTHKS